MKGGVNHFFNLHSRHMLSGKIVLKEHLIFLSRDILSEENNQAEQLPLKWWQIVRKNQSRGQFSSSEQKLCPKKSVKWNSLP